MRYRQQTKRQWARDDPAFLVLLLVFLLFSTAAYTVAFSSTFREPGVQFFRILAGTVLLDFVAFGLCVATGVWLLCNKVLLSPEARAQGASVEWQYCFDVHCDAYVPVLALLYVGQYILLPVLSGPSGLSAALSTLLYAAALAQYNYITFCGLSELRMLRNSVVFLYPVAAIAIGALLSLLIGWNPTAFVLGSIYFP